jgi:hypothetical protein
MGGDGGGAPDFGDVLPVGEVEAHNAGVSE